MGKGESAKKALVHTSVHIGEPKEMSGFGLAVDIQVEGVDEDVIQAAHEVRFKKHLSMGSKPLPATESLMYTIDLPIQPRIEAWNRCECFQSLTNSIPEA